MNNMNNKELLYRLTLEELKAQTAVVLGSDKHSISVYTPIVELGFSLTSLGSLVRHLNQQCGIPVPTEVLLTMVNLNDFGRHLVDHYRPAIVAQLNSAAAQQPMVQQPMVQQPMVQQPMVQQPMVQQPMVQQPMVQPAATRPMAAAAPQMASAPKIVVPKENQATLSTEQLKQQLLALVIGLVAEAVSIAQSELAPESELTDVGFDSMSLTRFAESLSQQLAITVHLGIFFEYSNLQAIVDHLVNDKREAVEAYFASKMTAAMPTSASQAPVNGAAMASPLTGAMNQQRLPVIIGSGITGLCISRALTKEKIAHIMIGDPMVSDTPKLGESMNELASVDFLQEFSEFDEYFFEKSEINFYTKDSVALLNLRGKKGHAFYDAYEQLGFNPDTEYASMIHIDRLGFDRALYNQVSQSPYCTMISNVKVVQVTHDDSKDTIDKIYLDNGQQLLPSYVYDATNHVRVLGKAMALDVELIDNARHVFFTHYYNDDLKSLEDVAEQASWRHATNIVRLYPDQDGLDGVAWLIPAGNYVSVGISIDSAKAKDLNKNEVMDLVNQAYLRRGVDYLSILPQSREIVVAPGTRHFKHKKMFGKNWLLAGGAVAQFWFIASSAISISLIAAKIAPKLAMGEYPEGLHVFEQIISNLNTIHWVYDGWINGECESLAELGLFAKAIYSVGNRRMALYALLRNGPEYKAIATEMANFEIPKYAIMSQEIRVLKEADLAEQTNRLNQARTSLLAYLEKFDQQAKQQRPSTAALEVV